MQIFLHVEYTQQTSKGLNQSEERKSILNLMNLLRLVKSNLNLSNSNLIRTLCAYHASDAIATVFAFASFDQSERSW